MLIATLEASGLTTVAFADSNKNDPLPPVLGNATQM